MSLLRRRMMMQQLGSVQAEPIYSIEWNSSSGLFPETNGEWDYNDGNYHGLIGIGGRAFTGSLLQLKANHLYERIRFNPHENRTATECELECWINGWQHATAAGVLRGDGSICAIMLTDGNKVITANLSDSGIHIDKTGNQGCAYGTEVFLFAPSSSDLIKFKVHFTSDKAEIYIDDDKVYETTSLADAATYPIGANKTTYLFQDVHNAVAFGSCLVVNISKLIYKEW